jgi:hypothetical protein
MCQTNECDKLTCVTDTVTYRIKITGYELFLDASWVTYLLFTYIHATVISKNTNLNAAFGTAKNSTITENVYIFTIAVARIP